MVEAPVLETERLRLRGFTLADFEPTAAMMADEEVVRHLGGTPHTREESWRRFMTGPGAWALLGFGYWIIESKADGAVLGQAGFGDFRRGMEPPIEGHPEMGWVLSRDAWGQGFASEAVAAGLTWADAQLQADQIVAIIDPENEASARLAKKHGFTICEPALYRDEAILLFRRLGR